MTAVSIWIMHLPQMAVDHYENFPVASVLLPAHLRRPVEVIYTFSRSADDIADEGNATPEERQAGLDAYLRELDVIEAGKTPDSTLFSRLKDVIDEYRLPLQPFRDLISAFRQDTHTPRYPTYAALLDYCRRSANPVGRLMLHLYGAASDDNIRMSDAICTALQLINFWQDVAVDWKKDRIYIPLEDMARFRVDEEIMEKGFCNREFQSLMQFQVRRTKTLMLSGAALPRKIPGRIGWELRMVVHGGLRILEKTEAASFDVFQHRPVLTGPDWLRIFGRSLLYAY